PMYTRLQQTAAATSTHTAASAHRRTVRRPVTRSPASNPKIPTPRSACPLGKLKPPTGASGSNRAGRATANSGLRTPPRTPTHPLKPPPSTPPPAEPRRRGGGVREGAAGEDPRQQQADHNARPPPAADPRHRQRDPVERRLGPGLQLVRGLRVRLDLPAADG